MRPAGTSISPPNFFGKQGVAFVWRWPRAFVFTLKFLQYAVVFATLFALQWECLEMLLVSETDAIAKDLKEIESVLRRTAFPNGAITLTVPLQRVQRTGQERAVSVVGPVKRSPPTTDIGVVTDSVGRIYRSLDYRSSPAVFVEQTVIVIEGRGQFFVTLRTPLDWRALTSLVNLSLLVATFFLMLVAEIMLWLCITSIRDRPSRELARFLVQMNDHDAPYHVPLPVNNHAGDIGVIATEIERLRTALIRVISVQRTMVRELSHELRTPLTALRAVGELFLGRAAGGNPKDTVAAMLEEAAHMQSLTEGFLTLTRATERVTNDQIERVDAMALIQECCGAMLPVIEENDQTLKVELANGCFLGRRTLARQALMNLIFNAISHCPVGSTIVVSTRVETKAGKIEISVKDDGPGIPPEEHEQIFFKFRRGTAQATHSRGHGLGLAIARAMVSSQGGTLRLDSAVGAGSTFTMVYRLCAVED